jgi:amino acid adenylation domain-containing protein
MGNPIPDIHHLTESEKRALLARLMKGRAGSELKKYPLSYNQQRIWFMDQFAPGSAAFNIHQALPLKSVLNIPALERSLNEIVRRHESLRTTFATVDDEPVQLVTPELRVPLPIVDLRGLPAGEHEAEVLRLATLDALTPFELASGPLIRAKILALAIDSYVLLLTIHHIVSDGWSMSIFFKELTALYTAYVLGMPPALPELPIQYGDFAAWQREQLGGEAMEAELRYWRERLADVPVLQLPTDRPRPIIQTSHGAYHLLRLSRPLTDSLKQLSKHERATLFMTLLAAFKALMFSYTGQADLTVGTYISNRGRAEVENLIGFFVNTLVLRANLSENPTFREVVRRVRATCVEAYSHQEIPFPMLVADLRPARDLSRNPLFQIVFQLFNDPTLGAHVGPSQPDEPVIKVEDRTSQFDLAVNMWETQDGLRAKVEYNTDLFDEATVVRIAEHFGNLLEDVAANPDRRLAEMAVQSEVECRLQLETWNQTDRVLPLDRGVTALFEEQVARRPSATAFLCDGHALTYDELNRRANRLARHLIGLGVGPEVIVGVRLERSFDLVVAMLAVWKAGGCYLPLDTGYPAERLAFMVEDSQARIVVTRSQGAERAGAGGVRTVDPGADADAIARQDDTNVPGAARPRALSYVIYTSGSTGKPKGVAVEQEQILNRLAWMWRQYPFREGEMGCQKTALSFVDSLWELLGPLLQGVPTVILPDHRTRDLPAMVRELGSHQVSRIWLVPSQLVALLDDFPDLARELPALKFWVSSGEPLAPELLRRFRRAMPEARLYNLYGASEVWDVTWFDPSGSDREFTTVPIGRPIDNMRVYVLNDGRRPVPIGAWGELYVSGVGVARGYLNRPELTAEKFVRLPFPVGSGALAFKTGDLARFLPDGNLELLGRVDNQLKIRGCRIEPAEVEGALAGHRGLRGAAVVASGHGTADVRLVAHIIPAAKPGPSATELRQFLRGKLPEFMIPSSFITTDAFPLTPSGKIDRLALLKSSDRRPDACVPHVAPRTPAEERIGKIWRDLLKLESVGVHDDFFDSGGHSLLATQLLSRVRNAFGAELPLVKFFETPTVAGLAELVDGSGGRGAAIAAPAITRIHRDNYRVARDEGAVGRP